MKVIVPKFLSSTSSQNVKSLTNHSRGMITPTRKFKVQPLLNNTAKLFHIEFADCYDLASVREVETVKRT